MGQFQDYLNKMLTVEQQGFNPMTESYSSRIGQLPVDDDPTLTAAQVSKAFVDKGLDDPLVDIVDAEGKLDLQSLTKSFNAVANNPDLGFNEEAYTGFLNQNYPEPINKTYYPGYQIGVSPEGLLTEKREKPEADPNYRFERTPSQKKGASDVFIRWDDNDKTGKSYITYESEQAYNEAIEKYKTITGKDVKTGEKEDPQLVD